MFQQNCSDLLRPLGLLATIVIITGLAGCHRANRQATVLDLKPYAGTDLRTVDVTVGGQSSPFIFDTGGGLTILTPEQIKNAGCAPFGQVVGFRADGSKLTMHRCGPVIIEIGGYRVREEVEPFDLMSLLGKGAPPVGGLLGLNAFDGKAVTLDLAHNRVVVETRHSLARRIRDMHPIPIRIVRGAGGDVEPFIEVRARTGTLWMEVDSGNNGPVFLAPNAQQQLGIQIPQGKKRRLDLDVVGLGKIPATVASRNMIYDGQLDPGFLKQLVLTVDFNRRKAWALYAAADKSP